MTRFKRIIALLTLLATLITVPVCSFALPPKIYETVDKSIITKGVTLEKVQRLTTDGWLAFYVLRVDLTEKYLRLDSIYNNISITSLETPKSMAESTGAVAVVNASFFEWDKNGGGNAIGTMMRNAQIDTAFGETNAFGNVMASLTIDDLNNVLIDYCRPNITLTGNERKTLTVGAYNKSSYQNYYDVVIMDRKWRHYSLGVSEQMPNLVEMVVEDGVIKEIRDALPAIEIPVNGFVAVTRKNEDGSHAFQQDFAPGQKASYEIKLTPGLDNAVTHIEGASMLVSNGKIPDTFSYEPGIIASKNPRTMVGCTEDGKELIVVVADGRVAASLGLDTRESAELIQSLGAHDAINLDGGGSSAMVARSPGTKTIETVNTPSDSSMRKVINGLGIYTDAPKSKIKGLIIEANEYNVFVRTQRQFTVKAYDQYYNPVEINADDVVWSVSGFRGNIRNGLLKPRTSGDGFVLAKVGRATAKVAVKSLARADQLVLNRTSLTIKSGESHTFSVTGRDSMGFSARINPSDIEWSLSSDELGSIENGVFKRKSDNPGYITATLGTAKAYCAVEAIITPPEPADAAATPPVPVEPPPPVVLPRATQVVDGANKSVAFTPSADSYRFAVVGEAKTPATDAERTIDEAFINTVNKEADLGVYVGYGAHRGTQKITKPTIKTDSHFKVYDDLVGGKNSRFIQLSSAGNGIRAAGKSQWGDFLQSMEEFDGKNVFLFLHQSPSSFSDRMEADLFKSRLSDYAAEKGYDIWVFYAGATDSVWLENGVRYFCCAGAGASTVNQETGAGAKVLMVTVQNDTVSYEFKALTGQ